MIEPVLNEAIAHQRDGGFSLRPEVLAAQEDLARLGDRIAELAARVHVATYQLLVLIREFDSRSGWNEGFRSCAHWLAWRTGIGLGTAREHVRVAWALARLPLIAEAMSRGELSYSKVRAITRVATPENEEQLLVFATYGAASHVERLVRSWRRVDRLEEAARDKSRRESRSLITYFDEDGMLVVRARLDPETGAVFLRALEAATERLYERARQGKSGAVKGPRTARRRATPEAAPCGEAENEPADERLEAEHAPRSQRLEAQNDPADGCLKAEHGPGSQRVKPQNERPHGCLEAETEPTNQRVEFTPAEEPEFTQRRADALGLIAETALAAGLDPGTRGDRYLVAVHVDAALLRQAGAEEDRPGMAMLEDAVDVSAETSRRLACDCSTVTLAHDAAGGVVDVGRKRRTISPALRRALTYRDQSCRFPGCGVRVCDAHHVTHWADGGPTSLDNLVLL